MKIAILFLSALLLAACARAPAQPLGLDHPANPDAPVPPVRHSTAIGGYVSQRPVEARSWRERNREVAPQPKAGE